MNVSNFLAYALNSVFWLFIAFQFHTASLQVLYIILAVTSVCSSFYSGYYKNKKIAEGIDKTLWFAAIFAHLFTTSAIYVTPNVSNSYELVLIASTFVWAIFDFEVLLNERNSKCGDSEVLLNEKSPGCDSNAYTNNKIYNIAWFIVSFCFSFCFCVLGYFEIPKAMTLIGMNNNSIGARIMLITILILGGISCLSVNYNCSSGGAHNHIHFTPFKTISDKGFSFELPSFNSNKAIKSILSFFGAVLNSTVTAIIATQIFNWPIWLMAVSLVLVFITNFVFHYCNQYDLFTKQPIKPNATPTCRAEAIESELSKGYTFDVASTFFNLVIMGSCM